MINPTHPLPNFHRLLLLGLPIIAVLITAATAEDAGHALGVVRELRALHLLLVVLEPLLVQLLHVGLRLGDEVLMYNRWIRRSPIMGRPLTIRDFQRI